jgi:hypothetical protein
MRSDPSLVAAPRPEPDLIGRWGIYSVQNKKWMDVIFGSEREASDSLKVLQKSKLGVDDRRENDLS